MLVGLFPAIVLETVSLNTSDVNKIRINNTCTAGVRYRSSDDEDGSTNAGNYTESRGNWLDSGSETNVWFERTVNTGAIQTDPGSGRLQMSITRTIACVRTTQGVNTANVTITMWDASSGGAKLDEVTFDLTAEFTV